MRIRFFGDSLVEGNGANTTDAAGLRPWCIKALESYRGNLRVLGLRGYGDSKFGTETFGSFSTRFSWWETDGWSGETVGTEIGVAQPVQGTTITTVGPHGLIVGNLWRWLRTPPPPFDPNVLYFVNTVPTTTTLTLTATDTGANTAISMTGWGSPPFSGLTGIRALIPIAAASENASERANVIAVPSIGTNDISIAVGKGLSASDAATLAYGRAYSLLDEISAAWPAEDTLIVFGGSPPFWPGSASGPFWATKQEATLMYREKLAAEIARRGDRFVFRNIWEAITAGDNSSDGIHGVLSSCKTAGILLAETIRDKTRSASSGQAFPRNTIKITRRPKLSLNTDTGRVTGPSTSIGASTFAVALSYMPSVGSLLADSTTRLMAWLGASDYNTGFGIASRNTTGSAGRAGLSIYIMGTLVQSGGLGPYYNYDSGGQDAKVLREGEWTDFVILFNAETMLCTVFRDGERLNTTNIAAAWNIAANTWKVGHISTLLPASQGLYQDFEIATGSHLTVAATLEYARSRLTRRARIPGVIDYRPLNEGTGTSAASPIYQQTAATLSGSATWANADTSVPPWEL
jgi:hypothetical protein